MSFNPGNEEPEEQTSRWDLSQYSERTRKFIFFAVAGFLVIATVVAIFVVSPLISNNQEEPTPVAPNPSASEIGVNPEVTDPVPSENPTSAEEEIANAQEEIINNAPDTEDPNNISTDESAAVPNSEKYVDIARNGVLAYCSIAPGETTEQRKEKMSSWFNPESTVYKNPAEFYYQRDCEVAAASDAQLNDNGETIVYVGVAWSGTLTDSNAEASTGYEQYLVVVDDSGILSLQ